MTPVLGVNPVPDTLVVENHSEALAHWAESGVRNQVVINFDAHDDFRWIPDAKIEQLKDIYESRDWENIRKVDSVGKEGLYHIGNWLFAGARLGIFREIYWVVPYAFAGSATQADVRQFLEATHLEFKDTDLQSFTLKDGRITGVFFGIPITICTLESLPIIKGPAILSIDTDFFPPFSKEYQKAYTSALQSVFDALSERKYEINHAVVSYSVNGEFLKPHERWVGDRAVTFLKTPEVLHEHSALMDVLQRAEDAYRERNADKLLLLTEQVSKQSSQASLLLYRAYALMLLGKTDRVYNTALESCQRDARYCSGLSFIASLYFSRGELSTAKRFWEAAYSIDPTMVSEMASYAECLNELGNFQKATEYYRKSGSMYGSVLSEFMEFAINLKSGERETAISKVTLAVKTIEQERYANITYRPLVEAIYMAIDFCQKNELIELASKLQSVPAVKTMMAVYPRESE